MELLNIKGAKMFKKIAVVADHRGEDYKKFVVDALKSNNIDYVLPDYDTGADNDYPDVVKAVYKLYKTKQVDGLILLCGTGVGMMIGANKCKGIRCVWAATEDVAAFGRIHEDCNALAMGVNYADQTLGYSVKLTKQKIEKIVTTFVTTKFGGGRHARRVEKLNKI